jgi:hypothetical protein
MATDGVKTRNGFRQCFVDYFPASDAFPADLAISKSDAMACTLIKEAHLSK